MLMMKSDLFSDEDEKKFVKEKAVELFRIPKKKNHLQYVKFGMLPSEFVNSTLNPKKQ